MVLGQFSGGDEELESGVPSQRAGKALSLVPAPKPMNFYCWQKIALEQESRRWKCILY